MSVYIYRLSQWLEKKFNAKGGNVITDLEQSARAVLPLALGVEERYLQGWNRFATAANQAAVAAQFSRIRIRNPVGSNVIIVMEQITSFSNPADTPFIAWGAVTADLLTLITLTFTRMDPRGNPTPTAIVSINAQAASGQANLQRAAPLNTQIEWMNTVDQQIPILPGQALDMQAGAVNTQLFASLMWRERALELSELT